LVAGGHMASEVKSYFHHATWSPVTIQSYNSI
jgi:hypothetical protein